MHLFLFDMENENKLRLFYTYNGKNGEAPSQEILDTYRGIIFDEQNRVIYANKKPYGGGVIDYDDLKNQLEELESKIEDVTTDVVSVANRPVKATYKELVLMSEYGQLSPGVKYQLTDYECIVTDSHYKSAGHRFDLIITANTPYLLNHECSVTHHDFTDELKQKEDELNELQDLIHNIADGEYISEKIAIYKSKLEELNNHINELKDQKDQLENREDFDYDNENDAYELAVIESKLEESYNECEQLTVTLDLYIDIKDYIDNGDDEYLHELLDELNEKLNIKQEGYWDLEEESEYFRYCNLNVWKVWYVLYNSWYDNEIYCEWYDDYDGKGKGVIYRMIDEYNNDVGYDFKNILMPVIELTLDKINELKNSMPTHYWYSEIKFYEDILLLNNRRWKEIYYIDPYRNYYLGQYINEEDIRYCYTFDGGYNEYDVTTDGWCMVFNNTILSADESEFMYHVLPNVICFGSLAFNNYVGKGCENVILNELCAYNEIIYCCYYIYLDDGCVLNRVVNFSDRIYLGDDCARNTFENENYNILLREECVNNTFDVSVEDIYIEANCSNNKFGYAVQDISLYNDEHTNNIFEDCYNIELYEYSKNNIFKGCARIESYTTLSDCTFEECNSLILYPEAPELRKCYLYGIISLDPEWLEDNDTRKYQTSTLHIEGDNIIWTDEPNNDILLERINELEERVEYFEDSFEEIVATIIEKYFFKTVSNEEGVEEFVISNGGD